MRPPARDTDTSPSDDDIRAVWRALLGREMSDDELAGQRAAPTLESLLHVVLDSDEFAGRARERWAAVPSTGGHTNVWHPDFDRFAPAPGTVSADGKTEVGRRGHLFLRGGSNDNRAQHEGTAHLPAGWADGWNELVRRRGALAAEAGVAPVWLMVPDKIAWAPDALDPPLRQGRAPRTILMDELEVPLVYPLDVLRALPDAFLQTDSHLSVAGNHALADVVLDATGAPPLPPLGELPMEERLAVGDLGASFDPQLAEVRRYLAGRPFSVVFDNRAQVFARGGHIGVRIVMRHTEAPDARTCVVFGDSFAYGIPEYQGLSWWLALVFREVHFVWVPYGWDQRYVLESQPDVVVVQGAERFCVRVPEADTDTAALVA